MLDVHPAHHAATTWRDFFIHIATICLGLLIAIGLEQSVEWVHHRHQLHQLREDLRAEGLRNLQIATANVAACEQQVKTDTAQYAEFLRARREHRSPVLLPASAPLVYARPAYAVWTVAQQNGTAGLLERADAQSYVRLYGVVQFAVEQFLTISASARQKNAALLPAVDDAASLQEFVTARQSYDAALLSPEELRQLREAVAGEITTAQITITRNVALYAIEWAVLHGSSSDEGNLRTLYDGLATYGRGGLPALLAKYPPPDSSAAQAQAPL